MSCLSQEINQNPPSLLRQSCIGLPLNITAEAALEEEVEGRPPAVLSYILFPGLISRKCFMAFSLHVSSLTFSRHFLFGSSCQYSLPSSFPSLTPLFVLVLHSNFSKSIYHSKPNACLHIAIKELQQQRPKSSNRPCLAMYQHWTQCHSCLGALWALGFQRPIQDIHPSGRNLHGLQVDGVL